jgi:hypothetical protein
MQRGGQACAVFSVPAIDEIAAKVVHRKQSEEVMRDVVRGIAQWTEALANDHA